MSFASLKKASAGGSTFEKLTREIDKLNQPAAGSSADERFWKPELDKSGNGYAVIRFLPAPDGEEMPWAKVWSHAFKGPGGQWYIENSLTTLGKDDPVGELNRELWNSGRDSDKEIARAQKRKLSYYANIYVVQDPAHPENEGRVFLYKFGKKIFDKLVEAMQPAFADESPVDPFNFWKGADFKLKIRKVDGYWNYDKSEFSAPGTLGNFDDDKLESIWKEGHSLADFEDSKNFKSYEQLQARLNLVLGKTGSAPVVNEEEEEVFAKPMPSESWGKEVSDFREKAVAASPVEDEEDTMSYFARLAEED
ncbi:single-stranded DNA binding protein [Synechococcus phage S-RIM2]|uniref:Single-stranded DNA-binding protein n=2 Tax=Nerrivikvirus srim2 TaxID=2734125 RepID=A0A1D7RHP5_9CAUD|nr:single strand DNA binding protein [Synechococcus phage S-RIM2 R1_1999]AOO00949.1 single-stranded DNA binding protein [Synechococcus phage S-RIM2]AGH07110.1 single-stranded DNA binding protein [Synechococcus phage S-RIM2 R1_1999]AOO01377.1 single-stranded DNA binding protein [Synechococcus phage S-RIM2]AOO08870.1 single-stranded DNA binding protein [Synechococcus phage S-RIM2]AOO09299.1 single-stranded DNA binding protein [Synechococcus phage S-RIM2]